MDFDSLRYFMEVYRVGTLTRAAEGLCVTQQAVSRKIIMLEEELGVRLFLRTARGMIPTERGLRLREKAELILGTAAEIRDGIGANPKMRKTQLKMGFSPGTLFSLGVERIMRLIAGYEDLHLDMAEHSDSDCEASVVDGSLDFAITINPGTDKGLAYLSLYRDDYVVLVGAGHPLAGKAGLRLADVARYPQVMLDDSFRMQAQLMARFRRDGLTPTIRTRISHDLNVAYDLVADNEAAFVFVRGLIPESALRKTVRLPLVEPDLSWDIGIISRPETLARHPSIGQLADDYRAAAG
ncbi:LysR family transcriptional regulator [Pleomorphomonas carboxyditropha]|uniref:LysR family transcriptional regulator n=1 Tax=Pleomorphomonas carboxyditropha TaxID=2023338 RepID=UPI0013FD2119|nr:LysR family transcriptional regulator [Pleomorphomonas carboxyditropha]